MLKKIYDSNGIMTIIDTQTGQKYSEFEYDDFQTDSYLSDDGVISSLAPPTAEELGRQVVFMQKRIADLEYEIRRLGRAVHSDMEFLDNKVIEIEDRVQEHTGSFHAMLICGKDNSNESNIS